MLSIDDQSSEVRSIGEGAASPVVCAGSTALASAMAAVGTSGANPASIMARRASERRLLSDADSFTISLFKNSTGICQAHNGLKVNHLNWRPDLHIAGDSV